MNSQNFETLVNLYSKINMYCAIGAVFFLILAVVIFFWLKIPQVFGELTGRTAKKAINEMTEQNDTSGSLTSMKIGEDGRRRRKGKTGTLKTGNLRKNVSRNLGNTGDLHKEYSNSVSDSYQNPSTEPIQPTYESQPTDVLDSYGSQPTDVLDSYGSQPTDVLDSYGSQPTDVLTGYGNQPTGEWNVTENQTSSVLHGQENHTVQMDTTTGYPYQAPFSETMVLDQSLLAGKDENVFVVERSIVEIHTDEVI